MTEKQTMFNSIPDLRKEQKKCRRQNISDYEKIFQDILQEFRHGVKQLNSKKAYHFLIVGKEGMRGYDNDDYEYVSDPYKDFECCYRDFLGFKIRDIYPHVRSSKSYILYDSNIEDDKTAGVMVPATNGILEYKNSERDLGITEDEFDKILDDINKKTGIKPVSYGLSLKNTDKHHILHRTNGEDILF